MSFKKFMQDLSDSLEVPLADIEGLFCGCSYLGEAISTDYEDDLFIVEYNLEEVDEDGILHFANTHGNSGYNLNDNDDIVIKEDGFIISKLTGVKVEYVLNIHRHVQHLENGDWEFSGMISVDYHNVKVIAKQ